MKQLATELRRPLIADDLADQPKLLVALRAHFGSFPAARRAAGLPDPPSEHRWTIPGLTRELRKLHRGATPITRDGLAKAGRRDLVAAAERLVGSVVKARALAKLPDPEAYWTRERVLAELRRRRRTGEPVDAKLKGGARLCFGGLREAYSAAGLDAAHKVWTRDELLEAVRAAGARGVARDVAHACRRMFGSVAAARAAALVAAPQRHWSEADILEELRRTNGAASGALKNAARRHFGSVAVARRAAGIKQARDPWPRLRVLYEIRRLGRFTVPPDLLDACERHFGSATAARRAVGVVPARKSWSKDAVLAEIRRCGDTALPPAVRSAARRHFGTITAARRAAAASQRRHKVRLDELV